MLGLKLAIITALLTIFLQDIYGRAVYWFLFPVVAVSFIALQLMERHSLEDMLTQVIFNMLFIVLQLFMVTVYLFLKHKKWINITKEMFGWGDILFLVAVVFYFSRYNFILFYVCSLTFSLTVWLCWQLISKTKDIHVPLAGLQSIFLISILSVNWCYFHLDLEQDYLITMCFFQ